MSEIRSYRRVFDLERRVYSVEGLRLNPGGVPVRGVAYFLALLLLAVIGSAIPGVREVADALPWFARDVAVPAAAATVLSLVRIEGRVFHLAAAALVRQAAAPRRTRGLGTRCGDGSTWYPDSVLFLPDGSDARLRRLRFTGPGAALVGVAHECATPRGVSARGARLMGRGGSLEVRGPAGGQLAQRRVIELSRGARLLVSPAEPKGRPG